MFTGLVQAIGRVSKLETISGDRRVTIESAEILDTVVLGDSIATNGVCLTVTQLLSSGFVADVSRESLSKSTLGFLKVNDAVHLERALTLASPLGGHLVSGHIDGVARVQSIQQDARSWRINLAAPSELSKYIAIKGSVCIDGVSLTINSVEGGSFSLNIVPHTAENTLLSNYVAGTLVNMEVDLIARYAERLLQYSSADGPDKSGVNRTFLNQHGYGSD